MKPHCGDEHCDECNKANGIKTDADRIRELEAERDRLREALEDVLVATSCSPQNPWKNCKAQEYNSLEHYDGHIREAKAILEKALASCKDGDA